MVGHNAIATTRHNAIATTLAVVIVAPAAVAALFPMVDHILSTLVIVAVTIPVAGYVVREVYRELRHRRLMRAIERDPRYVIARPVILIKR